MVECLESFYKIICCKPDPKFPRPYEFNFGLPEFRKTNSELFESNFVKTSKYTWYDFLPKSLLSQFYRLANIYFLLISILQTIPAISPLGPLSAWAPLIVVLAISMMREGYQDYQRYKSDRKMNEEEKTEIFRDGIFISVTWKEVMVGDICRVEQQQLFPADLILLTSSIEGGNAFIQTASLDGEKNLKPRNAYPLTQALKSETQLSKFSGNWEGVIPDKQLHNFSSTLKTNGQRVDFYKDKQLLYRGARLKNTKWIFGLAIYTGRNTKIMMNSDSSSQKMSQIERKVNYILGIVLIIQLILCMIVAILNGLFLNQNQASHTYIAWSGYSSVADSLLIFCTYLVLLNTMIPISLIVSIEGVKMSQSYFIDKDKLMYSEFRKKGPQVKSASLNEQLGQIEYIFTDKTGTLTLNLMEFKIAVIGKKMYGDLGLIIKDPLRPPQKEKGFNDTELTELIKSGKNNMIVNDVFVKNKEGGQFLKFGNMKQLAQEYLTALSVAHEVVSEKDKHGRMFYQGPSPDEISLVDAAKEMDFQFQKSTQGTTQIKIKGVSKVFELLETFPFNSDRKRMSVVIRSGGLIKMYIKGADSIIKSRLAKDQVLNLDEQLNKFSRIGLRTLLIGMRIISDSEYSAFKKNIQALPPTNKEVALNEFVSELQKNIYLIGATAVLDRLQDEVPETIRDLIKANIKIWMLTGDKMETAENIAKSCNLIQHNFEILRYDGKFNGRPVEQLKQIYQRAEELHVNSLPKALMIEGEDLTPIIGNAECEIQLANLAKFCESVVCCRLLPIQKADVVRIVRQRLNKITLSIGDGANDVPMIKTAHIGVGLFGEQGMGAVQASDYALPQFRMLWRLLLVHGRWNYIRIAEMILYFFYKNMLFTIPQFIFAFYCGYSGQTVFDDNYISLYNLIFTSFPLVVRAILEQDVNYVRPIRKVGSSVIREPRDHNSTEALVKAPHKLTTQQSKFVPPEYEMNKYLYKLFPKIYFIGQENCIFNYTNFFLWILEGIIEAILITFFSLYIFSSSSISSGGYSNDFWLASLTIYTSVIMLVTFKLCTHTKFWSIFLFIVIIILSFGTYISYMWISNYYLSDYVNNTVMMFYTSGETYFVVLFGVCFVLIIDGIVLSIDFDRGNYISKMRKIIEAEKEDSREQFRLESIKTSQLASKKPNEEIEQIS